ncbi:MAG: ubiquinol-cytochrome c reductase iron-sulfur subunit [Chloroflexota bacterium]
MNKERAACPYTNPGPQSGAMSRRAFLTLAWWGAAGLLAVQGAVATVVSLWPKPKAGINAGKISDFPFASVTYLPEGRFYISHVRTSKGNTELLALIPSCTHLKCVVPWRPEDPSEDNLAEKGRFNCPCHSAIYDRYGSVKGGPAPRPLDIFPITIKDGEVIVDTGTVIERDNGDKNRHNPTPTPVPTPTPIPPPLAPTARI